MKRMLIGLIILLITSALASTQDQEHRTLVNGESAPFVYAVLPGAQAATIETRETAIQLLSSNRRRLETVAPEGMWRLDEGVQTLVGYYAGGETVLGYRLIIKETQPGVAPVIVSRADLIRGTGGESVGIAPWELPVRAEPVLLDGDSIEWQEVDPLLQFSRYFVPSRIEDTATGAILSQESATMWRRGGTGVRTLKSVVGARYWYLSIETSEEIADGTGYVFRLFETRDEPTPRADVVVLVDGRSGPVALRGADGQVVLAGEYVRNARDLEIEISRVGLESEIANPFDSNASFDLATTRRVDAGTERFSLGTVYFRDILR